jgi:DnaD/phage-associated family protein
MSSIRLKRGQSTSDVLVSSGFLNQYMPFANGEYVKIYLYLLQALQLGVDLSPSTMADIFEMPEKDVLRAFHYWQSKGVLALTYEGNSISQITLLSPWKDAPAQASIPSQQPQAVKASDKPSAKPSAASPVDAYVVTPVMIAQAGKSDVFLNLCELVKIYFKLPIINSIDYEKLIWIYYQMKQDFDACEVLIEYCAEKPGKGSRMSQLEKLTCCCIDQGLFSAPAIRAHLSHSDHCELVREALGVSKKVLATNEQQFVRRWFEEFGFDDTLVKEACARTVRNTESGRFEYANRILESWHQEKARTIEQVAALDARFRESRQPYPAGAAQTAGASKATTRPSRPSGNKFNNFEQRSTDFSEVEAQLFDHHQ